MGGREHDRGALDAALFERLFREHGPAIYRFCLRRTGDPAAADDHRAVVFLEAWRRRRDVDLATREALPWLYGVAANVLRNHGRTRRRREAAVRRLPAPCVDLDPAEEIAARLDARDRALVALELVTRLPPGERDVVVLCLGCELTYRAAASQLGLPVGTVRSRLSRARTRLAALACEAGAAPGAYERDGA